MSETREAGATLNALVATTVMGWRLDRTGGSTKYRDALRWVDEKGHVVRVAEWHWSPSTDLVDAMEGLAHVGGIATIKRMKPDEWHVTIGGGGTVWAETLPLAICRALLDATSPSFPATASVTEPSVVVDPSKGEGR
jgi:hypothetical protein